MTASNPNLLLFGILLMNIVSFGLYGSYNDPTVAGGPTNFNLFSWTANNILTNVRMRYNSWEGTDLYIVFNDIENTNRYRVQSALPGFCCRTLLLKYTYTFTL